MAKLKVRSHNLNVAFLISCGLLEANSSPAFIKQPCARALVFHFRADALSTMAFSRRTNPLPGADRTVSNFGHGRTGYDCLQLPYRPCESRCTEHQRVLPR